MARLKASFVLLACLVTVLNALAASQSAQVRFYCLSLRFPPASTTISGLRYTLEFGTVEGPDGLNGELTPTFDSSLPSHGTSFRFTDPTFPEPRVGNLTVDLPSDTDENANGFPDFFEVDQGVLATRTAGLYQTAVDDGDVSALWSRAAGSSTGICRITMTSHMFGQLPEFTAAFELIDYTGTLQYSPAPAYVEGVIHLLQTGNPANTLDGLMQFVRSGTNRFDQVTLAAGSWTNALGQTLTFTNTSVLRDTTLRTNYFGLMEFDDGELKTSGADYFTWQLSINDANDADKDGIPDFTDDPVDQNLERPSLRISLANDSAQLEIRGQLGKTYEVEETPALIGIKWISDLVVTLTNQTQVVELPVKGKSTVFWRVKAQ